MSGPPGRLPRAAIIIAVLALVLLAGGLLALERRLRGGIENRAPDRPHPVPTAEALGDVRPDLARRLEALGYAEAVDEDPDPARTGVTLRTEQAQDGVNYFCTGTSVRFMDMAGRVLHEMPLRVGAATNSGCLAIPGPRGLVAVVRRPLLSLERWPAASRWSREGPYHHAVAFDATARLYTFQLHEDVLHRSGKDFPIVSQAVAVLSPRGKTLETIDLLPMFADAVSDERLHELERLGHSLSPSERGARKRFVRATDVFHPNSIALVDWPHAQSSGRQALLAFRDLDAVAVIDLDEKRILWQWGSGEIVGPHDPWLLANGNVLVLDNGDRPGAPPDMARRFSRVLEIDPRTGTIAWEYKSQPEGSFFTSTRGGSQPLANGNVLITVSTMGRVFEVTRAGVPVWEFWNPDTVPGTGRRRGIYRMYRMSWEDFEALRGH